MDTQCTMTWCAQRRRGAAALGRSFRPNAPRIGRIMREARALCARPKSRLKRLRLPCYSSSSSCSTVAGYPAFQSESCTSIVPRALNCRLDYINDIPYIF